MASYDGGPCDLTFTNGKTYSFSLWTPNWVENLVYPKGTAKIACIADLHYAVVSNEASADKIHMSLNGETIYFVNLEDWRDLVNVYRRLSK